MEVPINLTPQSIDLIISAMMGDRQTQFPLLPSYVAEWRGTLLQMKGDIETEQLKYNRGSYEYYQLELCATRIVHMLKAYGDK